MRRRPPRLLAAGTALAVLLPGLAWVAFGPAGPAAAAGFQAGGLVVARVGDGSGSLSGAATPVFLDEYAPDGSLVQSLPVPVTLSGTATSEGALARSADGRYLTLAGYGAPAGTATVSGTDAGTVPRVAVRVDGDGAVDASTALTDAFSGGSVRAAVTDDGSRFWTVGASGGVRLANLGAGTSSRLNTAAPTNLRVAAIAGGQLYASTGSSPAGVYQIGTGLPTGAGQSPALLAPAPSPYGVVLLDRDPAVPGPDTLYVADDSGSPNGGIGKFSSDGTTWAARGSVRPGGAAVRQLTGEVLGDGSVRLLATTTTGSANALLAVVDSAAPAAAIEATTTTLATAAANTVFRGVALAPAGSGTPAAPAISAQPAGTTVAPGATATLTVTATGGTPLTYQWFQGTSGDTSTPVGAGASSFTTPALSAETSYWVRVGNAAGSVDSATATVTVEVPPPACSRVPVTIAAVQGSTETSPLAGQAVTVRGTVVGDEEGPSPALRGFYLQDGGDGDQATSDGVFVFNGNNDSVARGQVVQVTGTVAEFQGQTQLSASAIELCASTADVAPTDVTLPLAAPDALERYEGMLVRFHQTLTVTEHFQLGRFGQVVLSSGGRLRQPTSLYPAGDPRAAALQAANKLNRVIVDDDRQSQNPDPIVWGRDGQPLSASNTLRGGDTVTDPVGVLTYTWAGNAASGNAWRLRPLGSLGGSAQFVAANPRPTAAPAVGGTVKVAGANLLNLFNTFGTTACSFGVGGAVAECRGAADSIELERQLAKEVAALTALDADVVGVTEIENDGYGADSAVATLVDRLNAVQGAGSWAFVDPDAATGVTNAAGTDAIKSALLYRPGRVTPLPGKTFADTGAASSFERIPVAQTFTDRTGATFTVVVNHFKSKGSCPAAGSNPAADPNADSGDGQGCWNLRRTQQAQELVRFLRDEVVPAAGDPDVLIVGDLNSYASEDPIQALEASGYVNLTRAFGGEDAYSYAFDGQWGYLDHALASPSLRPQVSGQGEFHINADEPSVLDYNTDFKTAGQVASLYSPDPFRSSDHDSVLVGLAPPAAKVATATALTSSANPATYGSVVRFTATVTPVLPSGAIPSGTVQFRLAGLPLGGPVRLVNGTATSPTVPAALPVASRLSVAYAGDARFTGSSASLTQQVVVGQPALSSPADGGAAKAGSTVPVRFRLTDAAGRPIPDLLAVALTLPGSACRVTVEASGAQTLARRCVAYDLPSDTFRAGWRTASGATGAVTVTVRIAYPGGPPGLRTSAITLQP